MIVVKSICIIEVENFIVYIQRKRVVSAIRNLKTNGISIIYYKVVFFV